MRVKYWNNEIKNEDFGLIIEGENQGKFSYVDNYLIKEIELDGEWVENEGYDEDKVLEFLNLEQKLKREARYKNETDVELYYILEDQYPTIKSKKNAIRNEIPDYESIEEVL